MKKPRKYILAGISGVAVLSFLHLTANTSNQPASTNSQIVEQILDQSTNLNGYSEGNEVKQEQGGGLVIEKPNKATSPANPTKNPAIPAQ